MKKKCLIIIGLSVYMFGCNMGVEKKPVIEMSMLNKTEYSIYWKATIDVAPQKINIDTLVHPSGLLVNERSYYFCGYYFFPCSESDELYLRFISNPEKCLEFKGEYRKDMQDLRHSWAYKRIFTSDTLVQMQAEITQAHFDAAVVCEDESEVDDK
jgi:hypothetical protein